MLSNPLSLASSSLASLTPTKVWQGPPLPGPGSLLRALPCQPSEGTAPTAWGSQGSSLERKVPGKKDLSVFVHLKNRQIYNICFSG